MNWHNFVPNPSNSGAFHFHLGKAELVVKSGKGEEQELDAGVDCYWKSFVPAGFTCNCILSLLLKDIWILHF